MKKKIILGLLIIILGMSFIIIPKFINAFTFETVCQMPLTTFSDGNSTYDISFPPGGGTTCETITDCPQILLPDGGDVFSIKMDIELSDPASEIGTPYIWIPASSQHKLAQLKTSDGSLVHTFSNGNDNCNAAAFSNPSRITVIPGGDVWVGNRNAASVTRLGIKAGCTEDGNSDCYECKGTYPTCGTDVRGVTFDSEGNIWAGSNVNSCLVRLCGHSNCKDVNNTIGYSIGDKMDINAASATQINGVQVYGLIADIYGYVWAVGGANVKYININDNSATVSSTGVGDVYGVGIDNEGDIWIGRHALTGAWEIDGADAGGVLGTVVNPCNTASSTTGLAVDRSNNVWVTGYGGNDLYVFKNGNCGQEFTKSNVCSFSFLHGVAIDFDNYAWIICDTGEAIKYAFHDDGDAILLDDGNDDIEELQRINLCALIGGCANASGSTYNYSDITGLRTSPITVNVGTSSKIPLGSSGSITLCTDGIEDCTMPGSDATNCASIGMSPVSCASPNASGECEIPINIFSVSTGDYTLKNLEVVYGKQTPVTTGGLIPCGRAWDDPATAWDDTNSCDFCYIVMLLNQIMNFLIKIAGAIAILAIIVTGFLFVTSAGNSERKNNAKTTLKWIIIGFLILFLSWLIADFILSAWGYLDPLGGQWSVVCD